MKITPLHITQPEPDILSLLLEELQGVKKELRGVNDAVQYLTVKVEQSEQENRELKRQNQMESRELKRQVMELHQLWFNTRVVQPALSEQELKIKQLTLKMEQAELKKSLKIGSTR